MRRSFLLNSAVFGFFLFLTVIAFRQYIFTGAAPIQFNLLPALYSPWKQEVWQGYERGVPNKPIGTDNPKLFYPFRTFTTEELKQGRLPLWNPFVFSGNVHAATYQTAVWYPLNILYFLLPQIDAWSVLILLQPILVGLCTFLFIRSQGRSVRASLFGSISFAFSGWMIAWWEESLVIVHSILWLPLGLWASTIIWEGKRVVLGWAFLMIALSLSILAGFLQMSIYLFAAVFGWNVYSFWRVYRQKDAKKTVGIIALAYLVALLVTVIQWLPALEAYKLSPRGTVRATFLFDDYLVPLWHLITLIAPDFWGNPGSYNYFFPKLFYHEKVIWIGLFPLLFALFGMSVAKLRETRFWSVFTIVVLSLGFALPTSWIWFALSVPVLSAAQPARIFVLFAFGASVLAAYGMDAWLSGYVSKKFIRILLLIISVVLAGLWGFVWYGRWNIANNTYLSPQELEAYGRYATISFRNLIIPTFFTGLAWVVFVIRFPLSVFLPRIAVANWGYIVVLVASLTWSLYAADKFLYFSDRRFEFPQTPPIAKLRELTSGNYARVWGYGDASFTPNMLSYYGLFSPEGYDALFSRSYGELLHTIKTGGVVTDQIDRTDAILKGMTERDPMDQSPVRLRLMSLLGVRYILEYNHTDGKDALTMDERFPMALFTKAWENDTWRIWEYKNALPRAWFSPEGTVHIRRYEPSLVELDVQSSVSGTLVLSDTYYPGWVAYVDGKNTPIERVHDALRGVAVEKGSHRVIFSYLPMSFTVGVAVSAGGILLSVFVVLYISSSRRRSKEAG